VVRLRYEANLQALFQRSADPPQHSQRVALIVGVFKASDYRLF
jgi:hypothetical protein